MATIPGTNVIAPVVPFDTADIFPSHLAQYGKGGHRSVADSTARDAISSERREEGMTVYVISENKTYRLEGGIDNTDWVEDVGGGGGQLFPKEILSAELVVTSGATSGTSGSESTIDFPDSGTPTVKFSFVARPSSEGDMSFILNYKMDSGSGDVVLGATFLVNGTVINGGSPRTITFSGVGSSRQQSSTSPSADTGIYIDSTEFSENDEVYVEFYRDADNGSDTHTGKMQLFAMVVE